MQDGISRLKEVMNFEGNSENFKVPFAKLTKLYGGTYLEYCRAAWAANDSVLSITEFAKLNGNLPEGFLIKAVIGYLTTNPPEYQIEVK